MYYLSIIELYRNQRASDSGNFRLRSAKIDNRQLIITTRLVYSHVGNKSCKQLVLKSTFECL
ncbi:unnamed protein product [Oikopleura dioica]|uniref:Uncharacterized protein n=1 Tax=Oikopleura dioica TaxID=34765 RepID=E4Y9V4_OIKDI|nr:unnamed protein product [Oikopleura dioica]